MKQQISIFSVLLLCLTAACATSARSSSARCSVSQIDEVERSPVRYAGGMFCGEVLAVEYGRTARILGGAGEMPPSSDLALLVTSTTRRRLVGLSTAPRRYYVRARIEPDLECFSPSESGEDCSPYRRPVLMHILSARPTLGLTPP